MNLINGFKLMEYAKGKGIVLPCFNTTNYELTYGIIKGLQNSGRGGYIQISSNNLELSSPQIIVDMVRFAMKDLNVDVPIVLHLDHGKSFDDVKACIDAGFTSIMIDASHLPLEENIEEVKKVTEYCHYFNIPVEAELGAIGGKEEAEALNKEGKTNSEDVGLFLEQTNCDLLAVSVGNVHGLAKEPNIDFELLKEIASVSTVPLVLHGGSGIPFDDVRKARGSNLIKVNYGSDLRKVFISTFGKAYEKNHNAFDVKSLSKLAIKAVSESVVTISNNINQK
ncbi:class II aldolase [Streptococcus chenjunshii]|uniref:Class II aldolase n=1 Tax=Streptococcus chenjunshii TaxID=2173853 RepID=A0A372KNF5_9STRE|nr:class II aldolase [Streptococcus chenjunshii]AXQ79631.1 class II aldolase [Streptococcus chenjunshii]RFU51054.1 class II aldolase [Streptococcus chenjunshii]RFU53098.1 class II aldolase [Streptococcus chenjunshii]